MADNEFSDYGPVALPFGDGTICAWRGKNSFEVTQIPVKISRQDRLILGAFLRNFLTACLLEGTEKSIDRVFSILTSNLPKTDNSILWMQSVGSVRWIYRTIDALADRTNYASAGTTLLISPCEAWALQQGLTFLKEDIYASYKLSGEDYPFATPEELLKIFKTMTNLLSDWEWIEPNDAYYLKLFSFEIPKRRAK